MCLTEYNEAEAMEMLKEEGRQKSRLLFIKNLMDSTGWTAEKAMDTLKIPKDQRTSLYVVYFSIFDCFSQIIYFIRCCSVRHPDITMPHQVLKRLWIHSRLCHVAAVSVAADMGRDVRHLHPVEYILQKKEGLLYAAPPCEL